MASALANEARQMSIQEMKDLIRSERELNEERIKRLDGEIFHLRELGEAHRSADLLAVETALTAAKEMAQQHNDLLHKMELLVETFATKKEVEGFRSEQMWTRGFIAAIGFGVLGNFVLGHTG